MSRWTTIAHHTGHGGYNKADKSGFFDSKGFAQGSIVKRATQVRHCRWRQAPSPRY